MAHTLISIEGHLTGKGTAQSDKKHLLRTLADLLRGIAVGATAYSRVLVQHAAVKASGTVEFIGGSGTVGATINGTAVTVAFTTDEIVTGDLFVTAVHAAAAIVSEHVEATHDGAGTVTLTSRFPGHAGNAVTLAASGTGVGVSGARLTGGSSTEREVLA
jgi:ethanolamine utilization protein EutA (predicted chaperonin)